MKRVMILGQSGSGKSRLARALSDRTGLPAIHLDRFYWAPGWVPRDRPERERMMLEAAQGPRWIIDGNYFSTACTRIARADTVILLDIPVMLRFWRVLRRTATSYGRVRPDLADGCPEHVSMDFWRWVWASRQETRARLGALIAAATPETEIVILRSPGAVRRFLDGQAPRRAAPGARTIPA
ncbi:DNA topology modulation kinase FlaR [Roseivivax marinus]|uniref:DNA topology modulation kinase FlaR n=1 Tax=Roseivivax marinus TaxID=1379903 RepID=W4HIS3_9RHOB|nr:hypothetical protein [Roseivivax marinus]ETW12313.1 DNA topology modulation kinase FlaR [Roseivivax marinus]